MAQCGVLVRRLESEAEPATFQTAWFVEPLLTELAIVFVMRTGFLF